ncbi:hypothetical protein M422DRAFT_38698 [Sphaerobolus stellatus SS14]|uniref:Uncharacterized protein n=1 Tax=Sphaerobolus stellatus (strain SS14) TaxID=990650 RepID=A0A0C9TUF7_SPHS4|nr:hypothetical protein M422DRAFT_38698 [Sphaerobolus stellatus SS14]
MHYTFRAIYSFHSAFTTIFSNAIRYKVTVASQVARPHHPHGVDCRMILSADLESYSSWLFSCFHIDIAAANIDTFQATRQYLLKFCPQRQRSFSLLFQRTQPTSCGYNYFVLFDLRGRNLYEVLSLFSSQALPLFSNHKTGIPSALLESISKGYFVSFLLEIFWSR